MKSKAKKNLRKYKEFRAKYDKLIKLCPITIEDPNDSVKTQNNSVTEDRISKYLVKQSIFFIQEHSFADLISPKTQAFLRFDFYIPSLNMCIEYDGFHHFNCTNTKKGREKLKGQIYRDKLKNKYCRDKGIKLVRFNRKHYSKLEECLKPHLN